MVREAKLTAEADFQKLMNFVKRLKANVPRVRSNSDRTEALNGLIGAFEQVAPGYLAKAQEFIEKIPDPHERNFRYRTIVGRLKNHTLLLADVVRPYPAAIRSDVRYSLLGRMIAFISRRVANPTSPETSAPFLLLVLSPDFKYVHFNYVRQVGLIGFQPQMVSGPLSNLSVLWHEVAGYAVAVARLGNKLTAWADELTTILQQKDLWYLYQRMYSEGVLGNLPLKLAVSEDLAQSDKVMETGQKWPTTWLAEFLEDLFWVMTGEAEPTRSGAIETTTIDAMAEALIPRYLNLDTGDPKHPPVNLRLLVGISYLGYNKSEEEIKGIASSYVSTPDSLTLKLAIAIAEFCRNIINSSEPPYLGCLSEEKELAKTVPEASGKSVQDELERILAKANVPAPSLPETFDPLLDLFDKVKNLDALIELGFTHTDYIWFPPGQG